MFEKVQKLLRETRLFGSNYLVLQLEKMYIVFVAISVLYKIYDYTKKYTKSTIGYMNYMLYEDAIIIRVMRRIVFQSVFYVNFAVTG